MISRTEQEVLTIACEMEQRGITLYGRARMFAKDKAVIALLDKLIADEKSHLDTFMSLLKETRQVEISDKYVFLSAYAQKAFKSGGVIAMARQNALDNVDALIGFAIADEEAAIDTYQHFKEEAQTQTVKEALDVVIKEERSHLEKLQQMV